MRLSEIKNEQARSTCLLVALVLFLIASWSLYRQRIAVAEILGGIGLILVVSGVFLPPVAHRFHFVWMTIASALGYVNTRILLAVIFFLLFLPYHIISVLLGRDPLNRRRNSQESYWIPKKNTKQRKEQFERLF